MDKTQQARDQLRVAVSFYKDAFSVYDAHAQQRTFTSATRALAKARQLDPNEPVVLEDATLSQDQFAARLLYYEALSNESSFLTRFDTIQKDTELDMYLPIHISLLNAVIGNSPTRKMGRRVRSAAREFLQPAVETLHKALKYDPEHMPSILLLARLYSRLEDWQKRDAAIKRGLAIDPHNLELLKLQSNFE